MEKEEEESSTNVASNGTTGRRKTGPFSMKQRLFLLFMIGVAIFWGAAMLEKQVRTSDTPNSLWRPTKALDKFYVWLCSVYETIGYYLGQLVDIVAALDKIWKFLRKFLPVEDAKALFEKLCETVVYPPFYSIKGFYEYYGAMITVDFRMVVVVVVIIVTITALFFMVLSEIYGKRPKETWPRWVKFFEPIIVNLEKEKAKETKSPKNFSYNLK